MKRFISFLLTAAMLSACVPALAQNLEWVFYPQTGEIKLGASANPEGEVEVPGEMQGKPVHSLGYASLSFLPGVTKVSFPETIRFFDRNVIYMMNGLKEIDLPESLVGIGANSISMCPELEKLTIPASVSFLNACIYANANLKEVIFEGACPAVADNGKTLSGLHKDCVIYVPEDQVQAYRKAFDHVASQIQSSGNNVKTIDWNADASDFSFDAASGTITAYHGEAARVEIPAEIDGKAVKTIGENAFKQKNTLYYVTIPEGVEAIADSAFIGCANLSFISFPSTLKRIEKNAFMSSALQHIQWANGLETIGESAFAYTQLKEIALPDSLKEIGKKAFRGSSLEKMLLGSGVESLEQEAFAGNPLKDIVLNCYQLITIAENAFDDCMTSPRLYLPNDCPMSLYEKYQDLMKGCFPSCQVQAPAHPVPSVKILAQPHDVTVPEGMTATTKVEADGDGLQYTWYYKGPADEEFTKSTVYTGKEYSAEMIPVRDARQVYCVVTDKTGDSVQSETVTLRIGNGVQILKQSGNITVRPGEKATAVVEAKGTSLSYIWYYKDVSEKDYSISKTYQGNSYSAEMIDARNGRKIYCIVTDENGNASKTNEITLSKKEGCVHITKQPQDISVPKGGMAKVTVEAEGEGLTYSWYYMNTWENKYSLSTTFMGKEYSVEMNENRANRRVYCVITDQQGNSVETDVVTLKMETAAETAARLAAEEEEKKKIIEIVHQPKSVTVPDGEQAVATVEAIGENLTYVWYYKDVSDEKFNRSTIAKDNSYAVEMCDARSGRQVYCVISNSYGASVQTETVLLLKEKAAQAEKKVLTITKQPVNVSVRAGEQAKVIVEATGDKLVYTWYYRDTWEKEFSVSTTAKEKVYSAEMNNARNGRQVYCVITDAYGTSVQTETVAISMLAPDVSPADQAAKDYIGTWALETMTVDGFEIHAADFNISIILDIQKGGVCFLLADNEEPIKAKWYIENGVFYIDDDVDVTALHLNEEGKLVFDMEDVGTMVFCL